MSVEAIGALQEPVRRAVYEYAAGRDAPVSRDEVAGAVGIGRTLAAFHLDRLAEAGLLDVSFARRSGRGGPGAGRPAKLYRRSATVHEVSLPPRRYLAAAELLAEAVEGAGADERLFRAARARGRAAGALAPTAAPSSTTAPSSTVPPIPTAAPIPTAVLVSTLAEQGYEPQLRDGRIVLRNCPFHQVARDYPPLVCGMNLALLEGLVEGLGAAGATPRMAPAGSGCCVVIEGAVPEAAVPEGAAPGDGRAASKNNLD